MMAALFTRIDTGPSPVSTSSTSRATSAVTPTSAWKTVASPPAPTISSRVAMAPDSSLR